MSAPGRLVVLTGASGSGKTTLAHALQRLSPELCHYCYFDSIGVPSDGEMALQFPSESQPAMAWQRFHTLAWIERLIPFLKSGENVLLEGQMRIAFLQEAVSLAQICNSSLVLIDCDDTTRARRLSVDRGQPALANAQMLGWAAFLRDEAVSARCPILDTGRRPTGDCIEEIRSLFL